MKRRIVPGGILALSLAVALLAATPSSASWAPGSTSVALATWNCPPPSTPPTTFGQVPGCLGSPADESFDFGYHVVGTSTSQRFALGVSGDTFNPRISVSGDYTQTNSCPPTLAAGADPQIDGCLITVTFNPTGEGPRRGTLTTGPGRPTMALTGGGEDATGPPDIQLSGKKKQELGNAVKVKASCGDEACTASGDGGLERRAYDPRTVVAIGDFKPASADLGPGETTTLKLKLEKKERRKAGKALDRGDKVKAYVTVEATDAAGAVATAKRTIRIVK